MDVMAVMDGSDSKRPCRKQKRKRKQVDDRISKLSEDIILKMSDLWKDTSKLDFQNTDCTFKTEIEHTSWDAENCKYVKMVNSAIESHQSPCLQSFILQFYVNKSGKSAVAKWLEFAWSRRVECLMFNFQCRRPESMLVLEELLAEMRPMNYLKRLCLTGMRVGGEAISLILRNCPMLLDLNIRVRADLTSDVHVCGGAALKLNRLRISYYCPESTKSVYISAPNLTMVNLTATKRGKLFFENVPKLVHAVFTVGYARYIGQNFVPCIISQLQKLTLELYYSKKHLAKWFPPQMPNLKELVLVDNGVYEHGCLLLVKAFISALPRLQKFEFVFLDNATSHERFRCPHQHLKVLKFQGSCARHIIELVTRVSDNCDAFQEINTCSPLMGKVEVEAHKNHLKQLGLELSHHIQFKFFKFT